MSADTLRDEIAKLAEQLRHANHVVTVDLYTNSSGAAATLGVSEKTMRNLRYEGTGPQWKILRRKPWYSLRTLVEYKRGR